MIAWLVVSLFISAVAAHLAKPFVYRALALPVSLYTWIQIWL